MTGNDTVERSIASLREKMDSFATSQATLAENQAVLAANHATFSANQAAFSARLAALDARVHENYATLLDKLNTVHLTLRDRIDAVDQKLSAKIEALSTAFAELRSFHKTVMWVCGGIITATTVALSVAKAVGWI